MEAIDATEENFGQPPMSHQERIAYKGDMKPFLTTLSSRYGLGEYISYNIKQSGWDDFNLTMSTSSGVNFVKCFAERKSQEDKERYLQIVQDVHRVGVNTPKLVENVDGEVLTTIDMDGAKVDVCIMQYLDGKNIAESGTPPTTEEQAEIIRQAALLNNLPYREEYVQNPLSIGKIREAYYKNKERLDLEDRDIIESVLDEAEGIDLESLPHALVHGDISSTNVMRSTDGQVYITDFAAAKWDPRIGEIAVLCADILFDPSDPDKFSDTYSWAIEEYQKSGFKLTPEELSALPTFVKLMQSLLVIGANNPNYVKYSTKNEIERWLNIGRKGLHYTFKEWEQ